MNAKHFILALASCLLFACAENSSEVFFEKDVREVNQSRDFSEVPKINLKQAEMYASLFSKHLDENGTLDAEKEIATRAGGEKEIEKMDFLIENGDTLLYAFNYKGGGFILIGAANASFPILAHAKEGNINLNDIKKNESGLTLFVETTKNNVKEALKNAESINSEFYERWKDLGKDGYEYEIELSDNEPVSDDKSAIETKGRRDYSTYKTTIYPYTGKDLHYWCQEGGYNYYAPNNAKIGCPAIAVSMLLYDCSERPTGNFTQTYPSFGYSDKANLAGVTTPTATASKLKEVTDHIPNYQWGTSVSGASPSDVLVGLRDLGFKHAELETYNFEILYSNLNFLGYNYFGQSTIYNRGVLICAYQSQYYRGHIWFCDGYYEQSYTVTKKFLGIVIKRWTEYDDRLYMNWGWGPNSGNGWYCATDAVWTSLDHPNSVNLKFDCKMFVDLSYYEYPI